MDRPAGAGVGKIVRLGKLPLGASVDAYYNVARPDHAAKWQLGIRIQFLFPS